MLTFPEEIVLLSLDDKSGKFVDLPPLARDQALAGAALLELAFQNRIDTDLTHLTLVNAKVLGGGFFSGGGETAGEDFGSTGAAEDYQTGGEKISVGDSWAPISDGEQPGGAGGAQEDSIGHCGGGGSWTEGCCLDQLVECLSAFAIGLQRRGFAKI